MLYGRAGEEILFLRSQGISPLVIPGISSALAAPLLANIPVTQRGVAESVVVCTGVGRGGREVKVPGYERERTVVMLMGMARLGRVVGELLGLDGASGLASAADGARNGTKGLSSRAYPRYTPIALIERASMPDQRVIASTLEHIEEALQSVGEQRPPGLMVVGWAVLALWGKGDVSVLDGDKEENVGGKEWEDVQRDERRVAKWLDGKSWHIVEGLQMEFEMFGSATRIEYL